MTVDFLDCVATRASKESQHIIRFLWGLHVDETGYIFHDILNDEIETIVQVWINHKSSGVERICVDFVDREIECTRFGLVSHEDGNWFRFSFFKHHLSRTWTHALYISAEGVSKHILSSCIDFLLTGKLSTLHEGVPSQLVNILGTFTFVVSHNQFEVVASVGNVKVIDYFLVDCFFHLLPC